MFSQRVQPKQRFNSFKRNFPNSKNFDQKRPFSTASPQGTPNRFFSRQPQGSPFSRSPNNFNPNRAATSRNLSANKISCQICGRDSHQALDCFHRMDFLFQGRHPPSDLSAMASQSNALEDEDHWLAYSGANIHITPNLDNLTIQQPYKGNETVATGNVSGLGISHTSSSSFTSSNSLLNLNDILHCPDAAADLLLINKF